MMRGFKTRAPSIAIPIAAALAFAACGEDNPGSPPAGADSALIVDHADIAGFASLSPSECQGVRTEYRIYYGHTSHGSQIVTGMRMLAAESPQYDLPDFHEVGDDLGHDGDVSWAATTRAFLDGHRGEYNVVMWSWCGGVSDNTEAGIDTYLNAMAQLETDYPDVIFVYMTGHVDGTGPNGNLHVRNNQIRAFTQANDKVLFDFADIESYDPSGNHYPDASDACEWCTDWCATHTCPGCGSCAHSHCFNCYLKGKAFWWMLAQVAAAKTP